MLHKCANPGCPSLFRRLSLGKLFLLDSDSSAGPGTAPAFRRNRSARLSTRQTERYWLCDGCSSLFTLTFERGRGMITVPLSARHTLEPALHLRQVQPTARAYRAELKGAL